jgi:hypothetical protein
MDHEIEAVVREIEAAVHRLPSRPEEAADARHLAELCDRLAVWRRVVSGHQDGLLRERAMWALLGAERCLNGPRRLNSPGVDAFAARVRLEAAARALRDMSQRLEAPPEPT